MNKKEYEHKYWHLFLKMESEMDKISDYVEICQDNYYTYSKELLKLYLQIGSELENVMKEATNLLDEECTILKFGPTLIKKFPNILSQKVRIKRCNIEIIPFEGWSPIPQENNLSFWIDYNKIKHDRIENFNKANLKNVLFSLAALYVVEMYRVNELFDCDAEEAVNFASFNGDVDCSMFELDNWILRIREKNIEKMVPPYSSE